MQQLVYKKTEQHHKVFKADFAMQLFNKLK